MASVLIFKITFSLSKTFCLNNFETKIFLNRWESAAARWTNTRNWKGRILQMVLIKLGKQQTGAGGERVEMQIAIPVEVLGLVCERKLHKQSLRLWHWEQFIVALSFSCCHGAASFSFSLCPCCYLSWCGCAKSPPLESPIQLFIGLLGTWNSSKSLGFQ